MAGWIEQLNDLALIFEGVRHIDIRGLNSRQRLGHVRLAVAGLPIDQ